MSKIEKLAPSRKKLLWFLEVGELFRKLYTKFLTQSRNILKILLLQFVATVKFHHPFWRNTFHGMSIYDSASRQGNSGIHHPSFYRAIESIAFIIKNDGMDIYFMTFVVTQNKVPRLSCFEFYLFVSSRFQERAEFRHIFLLHGNI